MYILLRRRLYRFNEGSSLSTSCHLERAFTFAECSGRSRNEDDRAPWRIMCIHMWHEVARRSIRQYVTQNNRLIEPADSGVTTSAKNSHYLPQAKRNLIHEEIIAVRCCIR